MSGKPVDIIIIMVCLNYVCKILIKINILFPLFEQFILVFAYIIQKQTALLVSLASPVIPNIDTSYRMTRRDAADTRRLFVHNSHTTVDVPNIVDWKINLKLYNSLTDKKERAI